MSASIDKDELRNKLVEIGFVDHDITKQEIEDELDNLTEYISEKLNDLLDRLENELLDSSICLENEETAVKWDVIEDSIYQLRQELERKYERD